MPAKSVEKLTEGFSPERLERIQEKAEALRTGVMINKLRNAAGMTQVELAEKLGISQQRLSKMEWGEDIQVGTLNRVLAVFGGGLYAHLPEGEIPLAIAID